MKKETEINDNKYLGILSTRLVEARKASNFTQQELAEATGITREKLNYAELNIKGRKLQIEELAEISRVLKVDMNYLVGLTSSNTSATNNLADSTNKIIDSWENDALEVFDKLVLEFKEEGLIEDLKTYIVVSYIIENILTKTVKSIKRKVENKQNLLNAEVQKFAFLVSYTSYFKEGKVGHGDYALFLAEKYKKEIDIAWGACGDIFEYYNKDKNTPVCFKGLEDLKKILITFEKYVLYELLENKLKTSIKSMVHKIGEDDKYFNKANKFINERNTKKKEDK